MRYLLLIVLLFSGCSNKLKFNVGDCFVFVPSDEEIWESEKPRLAYKVTDIGRRNYRAVFLKGKNNKDLYCKVPFSSQDLFTKVNCPKDLE